MCNFLFPTLFILLCLLKWRKDFNWTLILKGENFKSTIFIKNPIHPHSCFVQTLIIPLRILITTWWVRRRMKCWVWWRYNNAGGEKGLKKGVQGSLLKKSSYIMPILFWIFFFVGNTYDESVYGFSRERVARGYIDLHNTFGDGGLTKTILIQYLVIEAHTSYNILLGKLTLNLLRAVVSTPYLATKFPSITSNGGTCSIFMGVPKYT